MSGHLPSTSASFAGLNVVVTDVAKEHVGDEIIPIYPRFDWIPRLIARKLFGIELRMPVQGWRRGAPIKEERAYHYGRDLLVSPALWAAIKANPHAIVNVVAP
jgi:hypothetical protein